MVSFLTPVVTAFGISVVLCQLFIPLLKRFHVGQQVREDGPKEHLKKSGTPTMGGVVILFAVFLTSLLFVKRYPRIWPVLFVMLGFGCIGFLDDSLKLLRSHSMGLTPMQKLLLEAAVTTGFAFYMGIGSMETKVLIPFTGGLSDGIFLELGVWYVPLLFFGMLGCANGANFTDGIDGLASGVTLMISAFLAVVSIGAGHQSAPVSCAVSGALLGFLMYNMYPARVFMGDTGSLALGGFVAASAFLLQIPLFLVMIGIVYLAEVLSVILQVLVFRLCNGKRLFKMAPIHHHLELCGWEETEITALFTILTAVCCVLALFGL